MRGEICVGAASFFTFAASVIMVFAHIGQINPSPIPRVLSMIRLDVSNLGNTLQAANRNTSYSALYASTTNLTALGSGAGLRNHYDWGLLNSCGYMSSNVANCNTTALGKTFKPFDAILSDLPSQYQAQVNALVPAGSSFASSDYTGRLTQAAFWLIFIGSCSALIAFICGVIPNRLAFLGAAVWAIISAIALAVGAAIWTAVYVKVKAISTGSNPAITVHFGNSIILTWVSFALVTLSIFPYIISCCTFRR
ncbi:actin cortical patch SUR7/pH-response regulator pali [Mrakia frigida]|uniref:SUR7/PalI family protein n=1 Tax=Mrakia frigida TaxID=29902 RepID=UPI003FCC1017